MSPLLDKTTRAMRWIGNALLVGLFLVMLSVAAFQVLAREFGMGFYWGDSLVRMAVLWVTMVGAVVAIGDSKHIRIDLVDRFLPKTALRFTHAIVSLATAAICAVFGYYALDMVGWDYVDGTLGVGRVPAWIFETIIPGAAFLMVIRFTLQAFTKPPE